MSLRTRSLAQKLELMNTYKPQVSVVICTYNGVQYIEEQLNTILAQSLVPTEIIICDDGSSDGTLKILNEYCNKYSIIKLYQNPVQLGFNKNFEQALTIAKYDLIAISDQDDIWEFTKLEKMVKGFNVGSLAVYCNSLRFINESDIAACKPSKNYRRVVGQDIRCLFLYNTVSGHALLIKRDLLNLILPFPTNGYYDWWIAMVSTCNGGLSYVDEVLVYQRIHGKNQSVKMRPKEELSEEYRHEVCLQLKTVSQIKNISNDDIQLANQVVNGLNNTQQYGKDLQLFILLLKNSRSFFYKKYRLFPIFTWIKCAFYFSMRCGR